jgi:hypothetical protein
MLFPDCRSWAVQVDELRLRCCPIQVLAGRLITRCAIPEGVNDIIGRAFFWGRDLMGLVAAKCPLVLALSLAPGRPRRHVTPGAYGRLASVREVGDGMHEFGKADLCRRLRVFLICG